MKEWAYSRKYDAYYNPKTGEWIEEKCHDPMCKFCRNRPEKMKIDKRRED